LQKALGIEFNQVHFQGAAPAITALIASQIDVTMSSGGTAVTQSRAGWCGCWRCCRHGPNDFLPEVPTLASLGTPLSAGSARGFVAPAGTPAPVVQRLAAALETAITSPAHREQLRRLGLDITFMGPADFAAYWTREENAMRPVVEEIVPRPEQLIPPSHADDLSSARRRVSARGVGVAAARATKAHTGSAERRGRIFFHALGGRAQTSGSPGSPASGGPHAQPRREAETRAVGMIPTARVFRPCRGRACAAWRSRPDRRLAPGLRGPRKRAPAIGEPDRRHEPGRREERAPPASAAPSAFMEQCRGLAMRGPGPRCAAKGGRRHPLRPARAAWRMARAMRPALRALRIALTWRGHSDDAAARRSRGGQASDHPSSARPMAGPWLDGHAPALLQWNFSRNLEALVDEPICRAAAEACECRGQPPGVRPRLRPREAGHPRRQHAQRHLVRAASALCHARRRLLDRGSRRPPHPRLRQQLLLADPWPRLPAVVAALREAIGSGTAFGLPTEHETALAEAIRDRAPRCEQVRFCIPAPRR